jgi:hypothetical protein
VEDLVSEASLGSSPDFRKLRRSIHQLQRVSANMDKEKVHAEKHFLKALHRLERHQRGSKGVRRHLRRAARWAKRTLGIHSEGCARRKGGRATHDQVWYDKLYDAVFAAEAGVQNEQDKQDKYLRQFIKAALRVRKINQQLIAFERGVRNILLESSNLLTSRFSSSAKTASRTASGTVTLVSLQESGLVCSNSVAVPYTTLKVHQVTAQQPSRQLQRP